MARLRKRRGVISNLAASPLVVRVMTVIYYRRYVRRRYPGLLPN